jgi:hypothetical protein
MLLAFGAAAWFWWLGSAAAGEPQNLQVIRWGTALALFGCAFAHRWRPTAPDVLTAAALVVIAAAALLRLVDLQTAPYAITYDEAVHPVYGIDVLRKSPWRIFDGASDYFFTPYLDLALQALPCLFLEPLFGARLASVMMSLVSLVSTYGLASRLFDRASGIFATIILGLSYWHIAYARMAHPYMQAIMIVALALWAVVYALDEDSAFFAFIGGVLLGVATLLYTSARIAVPLFVVWWLWGVLRGKFRWITALPIALGFVVFLGPFFHTFGFDGFLDRYRTAATGAEAPLTVLRNSGWMGADALAFLKKQAATALSIYVRGGAWLSPHDYSPAPMIDAVSLTLALSGLVLCAVRWKRPGCSLVLLWVSATFLAGQILTDVPQAAYRAGPLLPALAIAAGMTLSQLVDLLVSRLGVPRPATGIVVGIAIVAALVPLNLQALNLFLRLRTDDVVTSLSRTIAAKDSAAAYYLVSYGTSEDVRRRLIVGDRVVRDVPSLSKLLRDGFPPEIARGEREVMLVLHPGLASAESAIRRCYPAAVPYVAEERRNPVLGLMIPPAAMAAGRECALRNGAERGLRARYYRGADFTGEVVREVIEDWPMRWIDAPSAAAFGSVEWTGSLKIPVAGKHSFYLLTSGGNLSASVGPISVKAGEAATAELTARSYPVVLRMSATLGAVYWLSWTPPGGSPQSIPPELFSPELIDARDP